jgi:hypothetical protein
MKHQSLTLIVLAFALAGCAKIGPQMDAASMDDKTLLDKASDIALRMMNDAGDDISKVDEPFRTVAIIYAAQGVIDNGGLVYFFENDWPRNPPYSVYADAYERIGRIEAANAIRHAARSFGIENPEHHIDERRAYMEKHYNERTFSIDGWNDCICGDERVYSDLASWVRKNYNH